MNNPLKGELSFESQGKNYKLQYSIDALAVLETAAGKLYGKPLLGTIKILNSLMDVETMNVNLLRLLLWAGLQEHHKEVTVKQAGEMIPDLGGALKATNFIAEAIKGSFPTTEDDEENPPQPEQPKSGNGSISETAG